MSTKNIKLPNLNNKHGTSQSQNFQHPEGENERSSTLANFRKKRREVEKSAQLLGNRVIILKSGQQKLIKTTRDTQGKTATMLKHRIEREESQRTLKELTETMRALARQSYEEKRRRVQEMHQQNYEERDFLKSQVLQDVKSQKAENLRKWLENRQNQLDENRRKKENVRYQQHLAEQNIQDFHRRKLDYFSQERERLIKEEERIIRNRERQIKILSKEEDKLLNGIDENDIKVKKAQNDYKELNQQSTEEFINEHTEYLKLMPPEIGVNKSIYSSTAKSVSSSQRGKKGGGFLSTKAQNKQPSNLFGRDSKVSNGKGDSKPELHFENVDERRNSESEGDFGHKHEHIDLEND